LIEKYKHLIRKNEIKLFTSKNLNFKIDDDKETQVKIEAFTVEIEKIYEQSGKS